MKFAYAKGRNATRAAAVLASAVMLFALVAPGCYSNGETTCGQESSPSAPLKGNVALQSSGASAPGAGSLVFVELCKLYSDNPDPSKANPNYRYVAMADSAGNFSLDVPKGTVGLHTLLEGYTYGFLAVGDSTSPQVEVVNAEALGPRVAPKASQFTVTPTEGTAGKLLTFSVNIQATATDPISEEVLLAEPVSHLARAFAPPSRGNQGKGFPNGTWTVTLTAPAPGTYTYYVQATSEQCSVSNRLSVTVVVR